MKIALAIICRLLGEFKPCLAPYHSAASHTARSAEPRDIFIQSMLYTS